jgi:hypothetical protein
VWATSIELPATSSRSPICCASILFGGGFGRATSIATAGARHLETGYGSFTDQVALELREGGEDYPFREVSPIMS